MFFSRGSYHGVLILCDDEEQQICPLYTYSCRVGLQNLAQTNEFGTETGRSKNGSQMDPLQPIKFLHTFCKSTAAGDKVLLI